MTARKPYTVRRGQTFTRTETARDSDGSIINITGYAGRGQVKDKIGGTLLLTFTVTVISGGAGTYQITATDANTAAVALSYAKGVYDIELFNGVTVLTVQDGPIKFVGEVTT